MTTLNDLIDDGVVTTAVSLGPMTTYRSGGPANYFAAVDDEAALKKIVRTGVAEELPILVLGRGSNIVVSDAGFPGLVIKPGSGFSYIEIEETNVSAGSAASLARVARSAVAAGLEGLEFFVGIPGSVGGAVRQNAGCFGVETKDRLVSARVLDLTSGSVEERGPDRLDLGYRHSSILATEMVLSASFAARHGDVEASQSEMRRITRWRRDHQPGGTLNAGSVFKNPPGEPAGALIDSLGLKGLSVGGVSVSTKHANFFVAGPDATSSDIYELVEVVKDRVRAATGTILEPEIQFVGFDQ